MALEMGVSWIIVVLFLLFGIVQDSPLPDPAIASGSKARADDESPLPSGLIPLGVVEEEADLPNFDLHANGQFMGKGQLSCVSCSQCEDRNQQEQEDSELRLCHRALMCYTAHVRDTEGVAKKLKGCARDFQTVSFYCNTRSYDGRHTHMKNGGVSSQYAFKCCSDGDFCNNNTDFPALPPVPKLGDQVSLMDGDLDSSSSYNDAAKTILIGLSPVVVLVPLVTIFICWLRKTHKNRMALLNQLPLDSGTLGLRAQAAGDSTLQEFNNHLDMTSGSGAGMPRLVPRTLAKQIRLEAQIGSGKHGKVYRGIRNAEYVAVKTFTSYDEASWRRETSLYETTLLRHDNILAYIGLDLVTLNGSTNFWIVTAYHPNGSLYDYLNRAALDPRTAHRLILTALKGLVHLHSEIHGTKGKPGIAHMDLKSKNILVRSDLSSVIADLGLAVIHMGDELVVPENKRVGTKRYMSPEMLDFSINKATRFEPFKCTDVYSFSLVMWEILKCTEIPTAEGDDNHPSYDLPFHELVGPDPGFDEMRKVVCEEKKRPEICPRFAHNDVTRGLSHLMQECWRENPEARLTSLRLKKAVAALMKEEHRAPDGFTASTSGFSSTFSFA